MKFILNCTAAVLLTLAAPALAGGDPTPAGKRGGKVVDTGQHQIELVAKDGALEVYLEHDDGAPQDVKYAKATATVLSNGQKEEINLVADPGNFLKGTGSFKAVKGTTIVVTLTMPEHKPEQARFKLD